MRRVCFQLLGLLALLAVVGCRKSAPPTPPTSAVEMAPTAQVMTPTTGPWIARVNGRPISRETFEKQVQQLQMVTAADGESGVVEADRLRQIEQQVLDGLIDQLLIEEAARKRGIVISDEALAAKITQLQAGQDETAFNDWLALNNLTFEQFKETLRDQLIAGEVLASVMAEAAPVADQIQARQILVDDPGQAQTLLTRLEAGADFAALAQAYSIDEATRNNGGLLGWFPQGLNFAPPQVEGVAFSLEPGQVSPVIESVLGYHIIKVEDRETARPLSPQQLQQMQAVWFESWLAQQRAGAEIERYLN